VEHFPQSSSRSVALLPEDCLISLNKLKDDIVGLALASRARKVRNCPTAH
jgi:hypothetical protein